MTIIKLARDKGFDANKFAYQQIKELMQDVGKQVDEEFIGSREKIIKWDKFLEVAAILGGHDPSMYTCRWSSIILLNLMENCQPYTILAEELKISYITLERIRSAVRKKAQGSCSISIGLGLKLMELMAEEDLTYLSEQLISAYNFNFNYYLYLDLRSDYV